MCVAVGAGFQIVSKAARVKSRTGASYGRGKVACRPPSVHQRGCGRLRGGRLQSPDGTQIFSPTPGVDLTQDRVPPYGRTALATAPPLGQRFPQLAQFPQSDPGLSKGRPKLRHERACGAFERAADPLHRAWSNTELLGNDAHTWPARGRQSLPDAFFQLRSYPRAP